MTRQSCASVLAALFVFSTLALAQQPAEESDAHAMAARPLMVGDLPVGTVTVRVARGSLSNAAVGVEVVATVTAPGGTARARTEQTKSDGRATFSDLPVGAEFHAEAVVDDQHLKTASFAIPAEGGARLMLVSQQEDEGEETAPPSNPHAGTHGHGDHQAEAAIGALVGTVAARDGLAAGIVELRLVDADGAPIAGQEVRLGHSAGRPEAMAFVTSTSDKNGSVRFVTLETGDPHRYMAAVEREGLQLSSSSFRLPADRGAAGELRVPGHTSDLSVLQVSSSSKLLIDLREDALAVMENLVLENTSDRIFRAGQGGLPIPLPAGSSSGSAIEGGGRLEASEASTVFLREAIPPLGSHAVPVQARFGFFLATGGESSLTFRQPMPLGMESPVVMVPEDDHLKLAGPGLQAIAPQTDDRGARVQIFQLASVPRNGVLSITVSGLRTRSRVGKTIATLLVAALVFATLLGLRRPGIEGHSPSRNRRDELFAELVEVERAQRAGGSDPAPLTQRRAELVAAIETVDGGRAGGADATQPTGKSG